MENTIVKKESLVDVAVLLIFWARPETLEEVWSVIKEARPSKLFLYQDGNEDEKYSKGHKRSREIVEEIDWECEVYRRYEEKDLGANLAEYLAAKWMFEYVERGIIFEDDDKPSVSFFRFCKELLDKYVDDQRISIISGLNHEGITKDIEDDYFFTKNISTWGWATWKRVIDAWDEKYMLRTDTGNRYLFENYIHDKKLRTDYYKQYMKYADENKICWESIVISNVIMNSGLCIVPTKNMIHNVGLSELSVNYSGELKYVPHKERQLFLYTAYDVEFPLKHPRYVIEHTKYMKRVYKIMDWNRPFGMFSKKCESVWLKIKYGNFKGLQKAIKKRLK